MIRYDVKDTDGRIYTCDAPDPETAAKRMADLHQTTIVATRYAKRHVVPVHPSQIEG